MSLLIQHDPKESDYTYDLFNKNFDFVRSIEGILATKRFFIEYDISEWWTDQSWKMGKIFGEWHNEIHKAIRACTKSNQKINIIDYQHGSYSFFPHKEPANREDDWQFDGDTNYIFPDNGEWFIILSSSSRTFTIVGQEIYSHIMNSKNKLFDRAFIRSKM